VQLIEERLRSLMLQSLAGDAAAYRMFLDELTARLRSYLRRRLGGLPDEVEDLLQELLLAVHNKRHTYDPKQPLTAWVQAIARYKLVDLLRRRSRSNVLTDPLDEDDQCAVLGVLALLLKRMLATITPEIKNPQSANNLRSQIERCHKTH
jgi:RNA polymerase sigma factor (sigma-70 family)